ncbi:MAG TPA: hypothetical protein VLB90_07490 [Pseudomonadales bacterium]|nr:hypothetical protein [Pseudomonadales bacterium]
MSRAPAKPFAMFLNPDYGDGMYRRRVRLQNIDTGTVLAEMEDDQHGFRITLKHDGRVMTSIHADSLRVPMTTCGGADAVLAQLAGVPLSDSPRSLAAHSNPRSHCTHQFDLLGLAVTHALRDEAVRQYDIAIHDAVGDLQRVVGEIDGVTVFDWQLRGHTIETAGVWQGVNVQKGFAQWAELNLSPAQLELALVVQRGMLVSTTRRVLIEPMDGMGLLDDPMTKGVCYSYSEPVIQDAIRYGSNNRNFTHAPEQLLRFA